jgi:hypothetical protein
MMHSPLRLLVAALALAASPIAPAKAADVTFPLGSRVGLAAPHGMTPSRVFRGFQDQEKMVAILIIETPAQAFSEINKAVTAEAAKQHGIAVEKREDISLKDGKAVVMRGAQEAGGKRYRKWLMFAAFPDFAAIITVEIPEAAKDAYPDSAVAAALASVVSRPAPIAEQLDLLPFKMSRLAGFRVVRVVPNSVMLTEGVKDDADATEQPRVIIGIGPGAPAQSDDREIFARQALAGLPIAKDMHVTYAEPLRINNQPGYEIRAEGKDTRSGGDLSVVQWLRFGASGYLRIVGVTAKDKWSENFPRFREIRDGIEPP